MTDIFISYARADRTTISKLAGKLVAAGYSVWWDHDIAGGAAFAEEIELALARSKCVIVAWSVKSVQSEWVIDEAGVAKGSGKLVPIMLDETLPPLGFRQSHAISFAGWESQESAPAFIELKAAVARYAGVQSARSARSPAEDITSAAYADAIAVLPLENLTGSPDQQFLVDGMHEALIIELSKIDALKVVSRTSAKRFAGSSLSLREIAAELGVSKIVEGSILRYGDNLRISVQLIDARSDTHLWAESFDRNEENILKLQQDVAREIAEQTGAVLTPEDRNRLGSAKGVNPDAYNAYLQGMYHWYKLSPEDTCLALDYFDKALAIDPKFAPAFSGIAAIWAGIQQMGEMAPRTVSPKIKVAASRALDLDPGLYQAHFMWGTYLTWSEWNWRDAENAFQRAISLNPNFPDTHAYYSHLLNIVGRFEEAQRAIEKALNLDPFNPLIRALYGVDLIFWEQFDEAIAELSKIRQAAPDHWLPLQVMRFAYNEMGKTDEALEINRELYRVLNKQSVLDALNKGAEAGGYIKAMEAGAEALEALSKKGYIAPTQIAALYGWGGKIEKAADWVETAFEQRDPDLPYLKYMFFLSKQSKQHPRIQAVLKKLNYPERP